MRSMGTILSRNVSGWDINWEDITPKCRHTPKLKLNIRSQAVHDWIEPIITSVFINQFAEHAGTDAVIESSPLRFSE